MNLDDLDLAILKTLWKKELTTTDLARAISDARTPEELKRADVKIRYRLRRMVVMGLVRGNGSTKSRYSLTGSVLQGYAHLELESQDGKPVKTPPIDVLCIEAEGGYITIPIP